MLSSRDVFRSPRFFKVPAKSSFLYGCFFLGKTKTRFTSGLSFQLEVLPRFELGIEVLQTFALPLGYSTLKKWSGRRGKTKTRFTSGLSFQLEVLPRFELGIEVLQTFALPLGYSTLKKWSGRRDSNSRPSPWQGDALPLSHFRTINTY